MQKSPPWRGLLRDDSAGARQALGRLPWFAPFFLRARRLRPVLPMVVLLESVLGAVSQIRPEAANRVDPEAQALPSVIWTVTSRSCRRTRSRRDSGACSEQERATSCLTARCRS